MAFEEWVSWSDGSFRPMSISELETQRIFRIYDRLLVEDVPSAEHLGERLYWVRARWISGAYARPPTIQAVLPNAATVRQGRRLDTAVFDVRRDASDVGPAEIFFRGGEPERFDTLDVRSPGGDWCRLQADGAGSGVADETRPAGRFRLVRDVRGGYSLHLPSRWEGACRGR